MYPYLNLNTRAPARLAYLKRYAAGKNWVKPKTWRQVRFATFKSPADISAGMNGKTSVWYVNPCKDGYFTREKFADEIVDLRHKGYYTDSECSDTARGIVVSLPHGRFIAGYYWSSSDARVYFPEIYTDGDTAAHAADGHAEQFAEVVREDAEKLDSARDLESETEDALSRLRECWLLRNMLSTQYVRAEIADLCRAIRDNRETLQTEYKNYI